MSFCADHRANTLRKGADMLAAIPRRALVCSAAVFDEVRSERAALMLCTSIECLACFACFACLACFACVGLIACLLKKNNKNLYSSNLVRGSYMISLCYDATL